MYTPGTGLIPTIDPPHPGWLGPATLKGTFPDYEHDHLTEQDGYQFDEYTCHLVSRCDIADPDYHYGGEYNCPDPPDPAPESPDLDPDELPLPDVAVLRCGGKDGEILLGDEAPGNKHGSVNVAEEDTAGASLLMPWKHEVYKVSDVYGTDQYQHYTIRPLYEENYHYQGGERNQLLPLVSLPWNETTERKKTGYRIGFRGFATDLMGCHGTSGSGIMQREQGAKYWELLGPVDGGYVRKPPYYDVEYLCADQDEWKPSWRVRWTRSVSATSRQASRRTRTRSRSVLRHSWRIWRMVTRLGLAPGAISSR
ncbi:MAG: hypothetical protein HY744_24725 [Deltaproteobacteria bacterium]|nr:hypothetical protein [Deltaproteobacteria bacterium]